MNRLLIVKSLELASQINSFRDWNNLRTFFFVGKFFLVKLSKVRLYILRTSGSEDR